MPRSSPIRRPAFTLPELLVVIAIVLVLLSLLLSVLSAARAAAKKVACANNLRQLVAACTTYQIDNRVYPEPYYWAHMLTTQIVDELAPHLGARGIDAARPITDLPEAFVCPVRLEFEEFHTPMGSPDDPWWATGYAYHARLDELPEPAHVMAAGRAARAKGPRRGVLWTDMVFARRFEDGSARSVYVYGHFRRNVEFDRDTGAFTTYQPVGGQHRAWSDGSVEWVNGSELLMGPDDCEASAPYQLRLAGWFTDFYWF